MNYSEKLLVEKFVIYPSWILLAVIASLFALGFPLAPFYQLLTVFILGVLFGFPHGATDHLVPFEILKKKKLSLHMLWLLFGYIGLLAAFLCLWFYNSEAALVLFALLTWIHWGQGELYSLIVFNGYQYDNGFVFLRKLLVIIIRGGIPLLMPIYSQPLELINLISSIEKSFPENANAFSISQLIMNSAEVIDLMAILLGLLTLLHVLVGYFKANTNLAKKALRHDLLELAILYFFFLVVPPLFAIGIYLFTWHSWRHLSRLFLCDPNAIAALSQSIFKGLSYFALKAAPTSVIATLMVVVLCFSRPGLKSDFMHDIALYLVVVSSLTLPHMVIVFWMDLQQELWTKKTEPVK
jgi:beta-carotene 15,15'-dioxygenase